MSPESPVEHAPADFVQIALDAAPCALIAVAGDGSITMANREAARLFGYGPGELIGRPVEVLVPVDLQEAHARLREQFSANPGLRPMGRQRDLTGRRRDGSTFPVEVGLSPIEQPRGLLIMAAVVDLTARKDAERKVAAQATELIEANAKLAKMASTDSLTALWNRRSFMDQLGVQMELAVRNERPLSVLLVDVDHFKPYNDKYGHLAGDEVLRQVAHILQGVARRSDYVTRVGGEEFAVILPETDATGAVQLAERFRSAVAYANWSLRSITVSIGATTVHVTRSDPRPPAPWHSKIMAAADRALYYAKEHGRNRVIHSSDLTGGET